MKRSTSRRRHSAVALKASTGVGVLATCILAFTSPAGAAANGFSGHFNSTNLQSLTNGLAYFALWMALIGIMISASLWAMGSKGQNPGQELTGKRGFIVCLTAAFFVGAAPNMINWLERAAEAADVAGVSNAAPLSLNQIGDVGSQSPPVKDCLTMSGRPVAC